MANFPVIDSFLNTYNANSAMLEKIARGNSSFEAAKNYARNEFNALKMKEDGTNIDEKAQAKFDADLREQTDAFESFLIKAILDVSLSKKISIFGKDAGDEIYSAMYNDAMSRALGGSMGISELLFNYLKERA